MNRPKRQKKIPKRFENFSLQKPSKKRQKSTNQERENAQRQDLVRVPEPMRSPPAHRSPSPQVEAVANQVMNSSQTKKPEKTMTSATAQSQTPPLTPQQKLEKLYLDPDFPTAYSANLSQFLRKKESISRHKRRILKFKRRKIKVNGPYTLIQADTVFYKNYSRQNNGYKYILVVVDCFSRKNWCRPMRTATADECAKNLDRILQSMPYAPSQFASDQGNEFNVKHSSIFNTLIDKYGLLMFHLRGPHKASIAERFIRTLKSRLERFFTETNSVRWIDILPKISESLNNSYHRSIKMAPNEVTFKNARKVFKNLYGAKGPPTLSKFQIGDRVRIALQKEIFDKGYAANWSKEIYQIVDKRFDGELFYYFIQNLDGSEVPGKTFYYPQELNLVLKSNEVS